MKPLLPICIALLIAAGCGQRDQAADAVDSRERPDNPMPEPADEIAAPGQVPDGAMAELASTQGNTATGSLALSAEDAGGVRITGALQGLKPNGEYGFHIHEKGDCSAPDASSAGAHFNPTNAQHGNPEGEAHHAGDMLNAKSDGNGVATIDTVAKGVTLHSGQPTDVLGKAIVLHEKADDYTTQPSGDSGSRIACGVITVQANAQTTG